MHHLDLEPILLPVVGPVLPVHHDFVALEGRTAPRMVEHDLTCRTYLVEEDHNSTFLGGNMPLTGHEEVEEHSVLVGERLADSPRQRYPSVVVECIAINKTLDIGGITTPAR